MDTGNRVHWIAGFMFRAHCDTGIKDIGILEGMRNKDTELILDNVINGHFYFHSFTLTTVNIKKKITSALRNRGAGAKIATVVTAFLWIHRRRNTVYKYYIIVFTGRDLRLLQSTHTFDCQICQKHEIYTTSTFTPK